MRLPDSVGVLRVLVTGSPETRATRVAKADSIDVKKASKAVADSDVRRAQYLRRFYGVVEERPTHYDLVLNSDTLSFELMSDLVVRASARSRASLVADTPPAAGGGATSSSTSLLAGVRWSLE